MIPTNATAQQWQTNLKANELAPFEGVLVPHETYRRMSESDLEKDLLSNRYDECLARENNMSPSFDFEGYTLSFSIGVLAAIFVMKK